MRLWWCTLILGAVCVAASPAAALDWEALGGASTDFGNSGYAYVGVGVIEPVSDRVALRARIMFSYLTYEFEQAGETVEADAWAVTPLVGFRYQLRPDMSVSLFGGGQIKRTDFDGEGLSTRNDDGGAAQFEYHYQVTPLADILVLYQYGSGDNSNWGRVAFKREVLTFGSQEEFALGLGVEGIGMGNEDFMAFQGGPLFEIRHRPTNGSFLIGVGPKYYSAEGVDEVRPYLSLSIYFPF
jgi:hypothetical protein